MKYILNEEAKYILNEGKYLLSERFLLNEDATTSYADFSTKIDAVLDKLKKVINSSELSDDKTGKSGKSAAEIKTAANDIVNATAELLNSTKNVKAVVQLADFINRYFSEIEGALKTLDSGFDFTTVSNVKAAKSADNTLRRAFYGVYALFKESKPNYKKILAEIKKAAMVASTFANGLGSIANSDASKGDINAEEAKSALTQIYSYLHKLRAAIKDDTAYNGIKGSVPNALTAVDSLEAATGDLKDLVTACKNIVDSGDKFKEEIRKLDVADDAGKDLNKGDD